ncbi:LysM peptidoglycan-binding domain-containing protein [Flavobacterium aciduliphilum]|uniref:LysM domain-containing protein n=1 Tax=Flavobacterium aciduliphilum TaxID=1101402 RepID=A0A328YPT7_9FLAO|nr:LysM peptidoglycan-binding domain-containing protein [Flavobacterium aciduliphilum]RAR75620.1 LysM domain-containing protein [Flavobacterium aciduliphilum]
MFKRIIYLVILVFTTTVLAQSYTKHTVAKGETIVLIAQKYKVTPFDIYKLNPDAKNGVQPNMILLIPKNDTSNTKPIITSKNKGVIHEVLAGETAYSIAKKYGVTVEELHDWNPEIGNALPLGYKLMIQGVTKTSLKKPVVKEQQSQKDTDLYTVVEGDTKYSLAKKFGITIEELELQNPIIKEGLPLGTQLNISKKDNPNRITEELKPNSQSSDLFEYKVKSGDTLYSLTHLFNLSESALIALNPSLKEGVQEGMVLKVPANILLTKESKNKNKDLTKTLSTQSRKKLALFLPFNVSKIENDSLTSIGERLKKDKFLNLTLDFYSGALMAIDSAKVLGINVDVKVFDSEETKNTTNALNIIASENFTNVDAVIGPFYQVNVEKVATALENKNIPVISPLSKDEGRSVSNLYQSMPQNETIRKAMFEYMHAKNGSIIAVIDPKKGALKQYIHDNQKEVKIVGFSDKGFVSDSIKKYLVKDRMNYVILGSEKTGTVLAFVKALQIFMKDYKVQMVILEPNETLDFEEIDLNSLTKLKLMYPSTTRDNDTEEAQQFEIAYKKKNRIFPNQYAVRGFDVTFDTLLRMSQSSSLQESLEQDATEQVEGKFDYAKRISGGYTNNGIYILYYDEDLTIKQAQ